MQQATGQVPVIRMEGVSKIISSKAIVDDLTLEVPAGQVFGFLGPNGAGKTTTIRMMVGLISISKGDIHICGDSINTDFEKAVSHVGAIVENPEMYKFLTGYQNLQHFARMSPGVTQERVDEAIRLVGLGNRIHDKVKTYSLGMRQRLGVAQAILHRPKLLVLDEPTNGLDPQGIRELRDYLRQLTRTEGITVFVSSHLLSEMELMCDRVAIIQSGRLVDIKQLKNTGEEVQTAEIAFEVNDAEQAYALAGAGRVEGNQLLLHLEREQIAEMNSLLAANGIKVYAIRPVARTLEDQFLEVTGGGFIG
ncbi:ABC transporter ATP-binding protein [Paenibacillus sp. FSL M8-0228]|jgi:ABC-2 type transport system ATP-binding protein|uniref:ABC transporter ATP-binding protein n=2 Tax=Paenibacillus TaxID=44249 RepID=A0A8I1INY2_PAEPO|nr:MULTISPECIES: ABC transporter ATP-binding protein [Paenibacillus]KAF6576495.1 ABC transporter ATP-binding protein [Paenibacillus sp. EKM206P]KAF6591371.1 ABC transporter ATP-binding protein [Paenibacillus sp. EKM205P]KEO80173.1 bacitracin ABC transporter ATP-binding protein [Paenibacillus polymyxa]KOS01234.1 bacitracin ABC transporter ATP-binding protein [Paenibacillus polymyxa]MBM0632062.1 ABC transporter ATP-binding protein [Paenibacillus polymyxa]